jgi:hypothetical protein
VKRIVICDLDNCISDDGWRMGLINWDEEVPEKRYAAYHAICWQDKPNLAHLERLQVVAFHADTIAFVTSRPEEFRSVTYNWIVQNCKLPACKTVWLMMRSNNDHRSSAAIKSEVASKFIADGHSIVAAFDDRDDVLTAYAKLGIAVYIMKINATDGERSPVVTAGTNAAVILADMADTFRERNAMYKDNYKMVPRMVKALWPNGVPPELVVKDQWHLFELKLVKLARFAISNLEHQDSIHDDAVYSAMIEAIIINNKRKEQP